MLSLHYLPLVLMHTIVPEKDAMQWLARTSRIEESFYKKREQNPSSQVLKIANLLDGIFKRAFKEKNKGPEDFYATCEQAIHCAFICRISTSRYYWEQLREPLDEIPSKAYRWKMMSDKSKPHTFAFNLFGEVVKLYDGSSGTAQTTKKRVVIHTAEVVLI